MFLGIAGFCSLILFMTLFTKSLGAPPLCDSITVTTPATFPTTVTGSTSDYTGTTPDPDTVTVMANDGWWCAKDYPEGQSVTTAKNLDSCFCVGWANYNISEAGASCSAFGGFLTDIKSSSENALIDSLVNQAYAQQAAGPKYPLFIGLSKNGLCSEWNMQCELAPVIYSNYNKTSEAIPSLVSSYMFSSDATWTQNTDPQNGTANGYICRINRNPCYPGRCNATQTCIAVESCAICEDPTTTVITTTMFVAPGMSNPVPYCDLAAPSGGWWCAMDYAKDVTPANKLDSCFCYMKNNETQKEAQASCNAQGGYLADIKSAQENDLMAKLVYIDQQKAPQVQKACMANWTEWNGNCYQIFSFTGRQYDCEKYCWNNFQTHLTSIHSKAEWDFILSMVGPAKKKGVKIPFWGFWTGATDIPSSLWTDGTPWGDYSMPLAFCGPFNNLMKLTGMPLHWWGIKPDAPGGACAHLHFDDPSMNSFCKWTPTLLPMWIGLQKTTTTVWNRGCEIVKLGAYIPGTLNGTLNPAAYIYNFNKTWTQQSPDTYRAVGTMCRKDRNPCGANNCTATQYCVNNGNCFNCINITTSTSTTTTTSTTSTSTTSTSTTSTSTTPTTTSTSTTSTSTTPTTTSTSTTSTSTEPTTTSTSTTSTSTEPTTTPTSNLRRLF